MAHSWLSQIPRKTSMSRKLSYPVDLCSASGTANVVWKIKTLHWRKHEEHCQGFPKENAPVTGGKIFPCFEAVWRDPNPRSRAL